DADTHDGEVALDPAPLLGDHRLEPPVALEAFGAVAEDHLDAVVAVQGLDRAPERRPEHPLQRRAEELDHGDVEAEMPQRSRHLRADKTHPDHDGLAALL